MSAQKSTAVQGSVARTIACNTTELIRAGLRVRGPPGGDECRLILLPVEEKGRMTVISTVLYPFINTLFLIALLSHTYTITTCQPNSQQRVVWQRWRQWQSPHTHNSLGFLSNSWGEWHWIHGIHMNGTGANSLGYTYWLFLSNTALISTCFRCSYSWLLELFRHGGLSSVPQILSLLAETLGWFISFSLGMDGSTLFFLLSTMFLLVEAFRVVRMELLGVFGFTSCPI